MTVSIKGKLILLRHGETTLNAEERLTGQLEVSLNETGTAQALAVGKLLANLTIDKVFSSTLTRAFNTALRALESSEKHAHLEIEQHSAIVEFDLGVFAGQNKNNSDIREFWTDQEYDQPIPGGESARDVFERVDFFYKKEVLPRLERGETVMVTAHSGIVRAFDHVLGFAPLLKDGDKIPVRKSVENGKPLVVEFEDGKIVNSYSLEPQSKKPPPNTIKPA